MAMKRILVVEDSSMTRSMIRALAEDIAPVETVEAGTGFEALRLLPTLDFELVITDINMPDINGLELINFIKKDERYRSIPLLIVSSERSEEDKRRGMNLGADAYVTKPFKAEELQAAIRALLKL
jgi:two-component system chemotaxis response regulator CheY